MPDNQFDVLIRFITEMVGADAAKATTQSMGAMDKQVKESSDNLEFQTKLLKEMKANLIGLRKELEKDLGFDEFQKLTDLAEAANKDIAEQINLVKTLGKEHKGLVKELGKEKAAQDAVLKNLRDQETLLNRKATAARGRAAQLSSFGTGAVVAGVAIGGGIIAEATRYAEKMGDATEGTRKFNAELKKIEESRGRIDAVLVAQVMPILEMASKVASKVAGIIEKNPELVSIALKGAALLVTMGTLAKIAATGFRVYADVTFSLAQAVGMKAAEMQLAASNNQLAAAGLTASDADAVVAGKTASMAAIGGAVMLIVAGLIVTAAVVGMVNQLFDATGISDKIEAGRQGARDKNQKIYPGNVPSNERDLQIQLNSAIDRGDVSEIERLKKAIADVGNEAGKAADGLTGFGTNTEQIVDAFMEMQDQLKNEDTKYSSDRLKITTDSNNAIEKANKDSAKRIQAINKDITRINEKAAKDRDRITSDFITSSRDESRKYESERANVIRDGGLEIQRIEQDRFEKLRQLEMDHNDRVDELAANRDALGLVLEQKKYDREKAEIDSGTNIEIEQRRQDLAIRLKDLAQTFQAERAQKLAQYQQDLADNEAKRIADIQIKQELLKEEQIRKIEEIAQIRQEAADRLRILMENHKAEILKIREAFTARRQELGLFLQGEAGMIKQAHQAALAQLQSLVAAYGNSLSGARAGGSLTVGHRLAGGYVHDNQVIQTHGTEFVASQTTTRALERLVGSRLNQNNLIGAVAGNQSIQLNDSRRFSGEYTKSMRREIQKDTLETLREVFKR